MQSFPSRAIHESDSDGVNLNSSNDLGFKSMSRSVCIGMEQKLINVAIGKLLFVYALDNAPLVSCH
jgi:hypothetical protein